MNDNVVSLNASLANPDMEKFLAARSAYAAFWKENTFGFLPMLHSSIERHYNAITTAVEGFASNAETLVISIESENLSKLTGKLREAGDAEEKDFFIGEITVSVNNICRKLGMLQDGVVAAVKTVESLPVYDASRDVSGYQTAQARTTSDEQLCADSLSSKQKDLGELEDAIDVFESNGLDTLFEGKLPTVDQVKELVSMGTTPAAAVAAVERALEAVGKLVGGLEESMRYSQLQEQRRALVAQIKELKTDQADLVSRSRQLQGYLEALDRYLSLGEIRQQWLDENKQICIQLDAAHTRLRGVKVADVDSAQGLDAVAFELRAYAQFVVAEFRKYL